MIKKDGTRKASSNYEIKQKFDFIIEEYKKQKDNYGKK
jgi:hypothetical protein